MVSWRHQAPKKPPKPPRKKGTHRVMKSESETTRKKNALVRLPHPNEKCECYGCDEKRIVNGNTRTALNWPRDYPPAFYNGRAGAVDLELERLDAERQRRDAEFVDPLPDIEQF